MPFQMALDEILFRRMETNLPHPNPLPQGEGRVRVVLRFYFSSEPWETVGYSYVIASEAKQSRDCFVGLRPPRNDGHINICRRITGGGRVEHGKDLIFSLAARKEADASFRSVRMSYLKIHEAVKAALEELGEKPRFYRCDEPLPKGEDCFRFPIATDLAVGGRKAAGGAQKRSAGALLHQESIPLGKRDAFDLIRALRRAFEKIFAVKIITADIDPALLEEAAHERA